uniref:Uncharacterized protein n=1 Tax=Anguilla anguilla TaxID=7936 RepID=A0A0E9Y158_ANGAN
MNVEMWRLLIRRCCTVAM